MSERDQSLTAEKLVLDAALRHAGHLSDLLSKVNGMGEARDLVGRLIYELEKAGAE